MPGLRGQIKFICIAAIALIMGEVRAEMGEAKARARKTIDEMAACMDRSLKELAGEPVAVRAERQGGCLFAARRAVDADPALKGEFERRVLKKACPGAVEYEAKLEALVVWPPQRATSVR